MTRDAVLDLFRRSGALLDGHFRLTSGLHSGGYLQCALVLSQPEWAAMLGGALADRVRDMRATVVLSPALGGVIIGHEVARALGVRALFAERQDGMLTLRRGFTLSDGPSGVRGATWDERDPSACLPAPILVAATWDEPLVRRDERGEHPEQRRLAGPRSTRHQDVGLRSNA